MQQDKAELQRVPVGMRCDATIPAPSDVGLAGFVRGRRQLLAVDVDVDVKDVTRLVWARSGSSWDRRSEDAISCSRRMGGAFRVMSSHVALEARALFRLGRDEAPEDYWMWRRAAVNDARQGSAKGRVTSTTGTKD